MKKKNIKKTTKLECRRGCRARKETVVAVVWQTRTRRDVKKKFLSSRRRRRTHISAASINFIIATHHFIIKYIDKNKRMYQQKWTVPNQTSTTGTVLSILANTGSGTELA